MVKRARVSDKNCWVVVGADHSRPVWGEPWYCMYVCRLTTLITCLIAGLYSLRRGWEQPSEKVVPQTAHLKSALKNYNHRSILLSSWDTVNLEIFVCKNNFISRWRLQKLILRKLARTSNANAVRGCSCEIFYTKFIIRKFLYTKISRSTVYYTSCITKTSLLPENLCYRIE